MAITYNGTPVTSVLMNGVTYTTIADENGLLYYACNPVYYCGDATIGYRFVGFDYDNGNAGGNDYARAIVELCGCVNGDGYICWVGGPRTCNTNMCYDACMNFQLGCIALEVVGCGYCGINYTFNITKDPTPVQLQVYECQNWLCTRAKVCATDTCCSISGYAWNCDGGKLRLYSPWVVVCKSDYVGLTCQSMIAISAPTLYPYCGYISAQLKNSNAPGYTEVDCSFVLNPLGCRNRGVTCSIQVC